MEINKIYNTDCLIGMQEIEDASIDLIICDLPYGTTKNEWDMVIPINELWKQYERIIKDSGAIVLFSQMPFTAYLVMSNPKLFKYEWIWEKDNGSGFLNSKHAPLKKHENILVFSKGSSVHNGNNIMTYNPQMEKGKPYEQKSGRASRNYDYSSMRPTVIKNDGFRFPNDVLKFNRDKEKIHPTQKPAALIQYLIRTYSNEGDLVLDNCMGSGTTAVACIKTRRNFIGFETDEYYYQKSLERIKNEQMQTTLNL